MSIRDLAAPKSVTALDARYVNETDAAPLALAGQTPSQLPVAPASVAAVGSQAFTARADHVHPSGGLYGWCGDGSDGDVTLDGTNTYAGFLSKSGNVYTSTRPIFTRNLTISAGVTLNYAHGVLHVLGTLTNAGTIASNGADASGATGGAGASMNNVFLSGQTGPNGGTGNGTGGVGPGNPPNSLGSASGAGGAGSGGRTGGAGTSVSIWASPLQGGAWLVAHGSPFFSYGLEYYTNTSSTVARWTGGYSGGAGGGDGTNSGGGGGGGGGMLVIFAIAVNNSGSIQANGGAGGVPPTGNCGGGGGGGGGWVMVTTTSYTNTGTVQTNGGAGGNPVGTGVAGSAGAAGVVGQTTMVKVLT